MVEEQKLSTSLEIVAEQTEREVYGSEHEIILSHREHGRRLAWSFLSGWRIRMNPDDVTSVVGMALCEAARRFDREKGVSFKTFFFYHLRGMLLKEISRIIQDQKLLCSAQPGAGTEYLLGSPSETLRSSLVEKNNPEKIMLKRQSAKRVWDACSSLDMVEQEVLIRYFIFDEPLNFIAEDMKYCRCHVSRVKSRALAKLGKLLAEDENAKDLPAFTALQRNNSASLRSKPRAAAYSGGRGRRLLEKKSERSKALQIVLAQTGY
jgi:RNA polymerase sigma factor (sigma-70 family)